MNLDKLEDKSVYEVCNLVYKNFPELPNTIEETFEPLMDFYEDSKETTIRELKEMDKNWYDKLKKGIEGITLYIQDYPDLFDSK